MLLIGSRALEYWLKPGFKCMDNSDWDIITFKDKDYFKGSKRVEVHSIFELNNNEIFEQYGKLGTVDINGITVRVCSLKGLAVLKRSHLYRDYQFTKHIAHYKILKDSVGDFTALDTAIVNKRTELTKKTYPQPNPKLDQSNEDFFDDAVTKKYDHDWLHEQVAYLDEPLYISLKNDKSKAWCEKDLWDVMPYDLKIACVAEETYVIACERFLIPQNWPNKYKRSYLTSLNKVCTTLTSGWFRDFAIDNYYEIADKFSVNKFNQIKERVQNGPS